MTEESNQGCVIDVRGVIFEGAPVPESVVSTGLIATEQSRFVEPSKAVSERRTTISSGGGWAGPPGSELAEDPLGQPDTRLDQVSAHPVDVRRPGWRGVWVFGDPRLVPDRLSEKRD